MESLRNEKTKGKLVRSRAQWVDEGEKSTKYFCELESKNYTSKIIPKVEKDNGEINCYRSEGDIKRSTIFL